MSKFDFAIGELRCGRLPWVNGWVWLTLAIFVASFIAGYGADLYVIDIANGNISK